MSLDTGIFMLLLTGLYLIPSYHLFQKHSLTIVAIVCKRTCRHTHSQCIICGERKKKPTLSQYSLVLIIYSQSQVKTLVTYHELPSTSTTHSHFYRSHYLHIYFLFNIIGPNQINPVKHNSFRHI